MQNTIEVAKVTVSDVMGKLVYYATMRNNVLFDGYSKAEMIEKATYMQMKLDWKGCKRA